MNDAAFVKKVNIIIERRVEIIKIEKENSRWTFIIVAQNPESRHRVVYDSGRRRMVCDCEDYLYHEPCCFHSIKAAQFLLDCMYANRLVDWQPDPLKEKLPNLIQQEAKHKLYEFSPILFGLGFGEPPLIPEAQWKPLVDVEIGPAPAISPPPVGKPEAAEEPEDRESGDWWNENEGKLALEDTVHSKPEAVVAPGEAPTEATLEAPKAEEAVVPEEELEELPRLAEVASLLGEEVHFVLSARMTLLMPDESWLKLGFESMEFSIASDKLEEISRINEALLGEMLALSRKAQNQLYGVMARGTEEEIETRPPESYQTVTEEEPEGGGFGYSEEDKDAGDYWA